MMKKVKNRMQFLSWQPHIGMQYNYVMGVIYRGTCDFNDSIPYLAEKTHIWWEDSLFHTL